MSESANVLIIGRHPSISRSVLATLAEAGHTGKSSDTVQGAIDLARQEHFDVFLIGGAVTPEEEREAVEGVREFLPDIRVKRRNIYSQAGPAGMVREALKQAAGSAVE